MQRLKYRTEEWDRDFFEYLDKLRKDHKDKAVILTGDLNVAREPIDIFDAKGKEKTSCYTPQERASFEGFLDRGFVDVFRSIYPVKQEFTYFSLRTKAKPVNKGWRIDYFVIDEEHLSLIKDTRIHKHFDGSDHVPIELELDLASG